MRLSHFVLLIALVWPAAIPGALTLTEEERAALPPEALAEFDRAVEILGQRQYETGIAHLRRAASLAPEHARLQLVLGEIATNMALHTGGPRSQTYLDIATEAYQRVLDNPQAAEADRALAQRLASELPAVTRAIEQQRLIEERQAQGRRLLQQMQASAELQRAATESPLPGAAPPSPAPAPAAAPAPNRSLQAIQDARQLRDASQQP